MHPYYNGEGYPSGGDGYPANGEGYPSDYSPQRSGSIRYEVRRKNKIRPSAKLSLRFAQVKLCPSGKAKLYISLCVPII